MQKKCGKGRPRNSLLTDFPGREVGKDLAPWRSLGIIFPPSPSPTSGGNLSGVFVIHGKVIDHRTARRGTMEFGVFWGGLGFSKFRNFFKNLGGFLDPVKTHGVSAARRGQTVVGAGDGLESEDVAPERLAVGVQLPCRLRAREGAGGVRFCLIL